ncbi:hypothetical protein AGMMS49556_07460 [Endomicrobiia bacterium]|nr:hypothetical protein AGMMS49556_07460 [Endomicrobiia bacterium]
MFTNKVFANEIKNRSKDLFEIDYIKRKDFLNKNIGKKRKAVKIAIGKNIVLTDNYITVPIEREKLNQINGIFEVEITDKSEI